MADNDDRKRPGPSLSSVTPSPTRQKRRCIEGWCEDRSNGEDCYCFQARKGQCCQSCNRRIEPGHCIIKGGQGWVHVRCRGDEDRGVSTILQGLNHNVQMLESGDVGVGFNGARQRLTFDAETESSSAIVVTQADEDEDDSGQLPWTQEQIDILSYEASLGDLICVNALAGCGKTTTIALLCNSLLEENNIEILYVVFGKKNQEEARASNKFPKEGMTILTSHACIRKLYFGVPNFMKCKPVDLSRADISQMLELESFVREKFQDITPKMVERRTLSIAGYVEKTLKNLLVSVATQVKGDHVCWQARKLGSIRTEWRTFVPIQRYIEWAQAIFDEIHSRCRRVRDAGTEEEIPHDAYVKVAQLEEIVLSYDVLVVDEAQDMTPCQASLFWGDRDDKVVYLFGDEWQQLYRFRGANDSFKECRRVEGTVNMHLTGSFRFGKEIAQLATLALRYGGGEQVTGRSATPGTVREGYKFRKGTVICRSNIGMYNYLLHNGLHVKKWTFLKPSSKAPEPSKLALSLEDFLRDETGTFKRRGEVFKRRGEIVEYCEDGEDMELLKCLILVEMLIENETNVIDFYEMIQRSFVPLSTDDSLDDFDGVILTTCHGAKGLEFENVYIHDDFKFDAIISAVDLLNKPRICDEINLVYVAVTRAKESVYLSDKCREFFHHINPNKLVSTTSLKSRRDEWEENWRLFESDSVSLESVSDVPWPSGPSPNNPFCLDCLMSEEEQRTYVQRMLRRFHPDKFLPRHTQRMKECDAEGLRLIVVDDYANYNDSLHGSQPILKALDVRSYRSSNCVLS